MLDFFFGVIVGRVKYGMGELGVKVGLVDGSFGLGRRAQGKQGRPDRVCGGAQRSFVPWIAD